MRPIHSLRALTGEEERVLQRTAKATSERVDLLKRAKALLAVKAGQGIPQQRRRPDTKAEIV